MPEKKASEFSQSEKGETFALGEEIPKVSSGIDMRSSDPLISLDKENEKQIVLNIADAKGGKILLHKRRDLGFQLTGNRLTDVYHQVNDYFISKTKIKLTEVATFFRLIGVMLNAGLPLIRSLNTLAAQTQKNPRFSGILYKMAMGIEGGKSLSEAMSDYGDVFSEAAVGMVKAGEASGQLNNSLRMLADELEKSASIRGKVKGALVYPVVIFVLLIVVMFLMMILVIPQITKLFTQAEVALPLPTRILIAVSDFCVHSWPLLLIFLTGSIVGFHFFRKTRGGRHALDLMKLKLPIFGSLIKKNALSKFARSFSNLMGSGVPIITSIEIVAHAIGNEVYKRRLILTAEDMRRGIPIAENLAESSLFPTMLVNMVEIGEQTAQLENVMQKVADFYDEEIDTAVRSLTKIMEPLILVIIGLVVGGLVAAIMLPIIQLTNVAGGV